MLQIWQLHKTGCNTEYARGGKTGFCGTRNSRELRVERRESEKSEKEIIGKVKKRVVDSKS